MGTMAVGATAYALTPKQRCGSPRVGAARRGASEECASTTRSSSGGGMADAGGRGAECLAGAAAAWTRSAAPDKQRGGFGSFAHAFSTHISGGG